MQTINRKTRRDYLKRTKQLRIKAKLPLSERFELIRNNIKNGNEQQIQFRNECQQNYIKGLELIETKMTQLYRDQLKYSEEEVEARMMEWAESVMWPTPKKPTIKK